VMDLENEKKEVLGKAKQLEEQLNTSTKELAKQHAAEKAKLEKKTKSELDSVNLKRQ
jgi:hypothetical protein